MRKFFANPASAISLFLIILFSAATVCAQENAASNQKNNRVDDSGALATPTQTSDAFDSKNELSVLGGFAPDIPRVFGGARPSKYGFAAIRYSRRLLASENVALKYTIDAIPLAVISYEKRPIVQTAPTTFAVRPQDTTVYGVGLTPVGFQLNFRRRSKVQPYISANAGMLYFKDLIPDDRSAVFPDRKGKRYNFTLAGGGGVEFASDSGKSYTVGFKFHHISNASSGNINPGFDQNLFYFGYTFKKW